MNVYQINDPNGLKDKLKQFDAIKTKETND